jgi:hypothetical protein
MIVAVRVNYEHSGAMPDARIKPDGASRDIETICTLQFGNAREALSEED